MTGRNSPCDCGSGKKFKHCHGSAAGFQGTETRDQLQAAIGLFQQGRKNEAYDLAVASPNSLERTRLLITILIGRHQPADIEKALKLIAKWKRNAPASPEPWARQIEIHIFKNQLSLAQSAFNELKRRAPRHARTLYYKGLLLQLSGHLKQAHIAYRESAQIRHEAVPGKPQPGEKAANALAAITAYKTAIGSHPGTRSKNIMRLLDQPAVLDLLQSSLEQWENDIQATGTTIAGNEADSLAKAWYQLGCVYLGTDESVRCFHKALKWNEDHEKARQDALFVLNYNTRLTSREIYQEHLKSGHELQRRYPCKGLVFQNDRDQTRALRIGYLSSDFRQHPVAKFILPVLELHDPERVTIFLYHDHQKEDEYTNKARQFAHKFRQVRDLKNNDLANQIIEDRIDILVDLNGHTGSGRMPVLSRRAAPVQISWIGYPNTTGLDTVDYRIVDEVTDPKSYAQDFCTERLLYMRRNFSVYDPLETLPPVVPSPCLKSGTVTFGSFNNLAKVNDPLMVSWAEILGRVPGSQLLIKDIALGFEAPRQRILEVFKQNGICSDRIVFTGHIKSRFEHLQCFNAVDICLDSFPYNGTTTSCESLIMGVPVVTRAGEDHRSRVTASQLKALDLDSLIAYGENEYIELATALALDHERLKLLRNGLREKMQASPLMDARSFTRELESAYQRVWAHWCELQA